MVTITPMLTRASIKPSRSQPWSTALGNNPGEGPLVAQLDPNPRALPSTGRLLYRQAIVGPPQLTHPPTPLAPQKNQLIFSPRHRLC